MILLAAFLMALMPAYAYQSSLSETGGELLWSNPNVPLVIQTNTSDMNSTTARNIILTSIAEWNSVSSARINSVSSATNEIKFMSQFPYGSAVIGITELTFGNSGSIQKASIILNDDYYFQSTPGLYPAGQIFLGDVVTHELGHLFGLSHSEVLNSSMFYSSFSGQSTISSDDKAGILAKYSNVGSITGYVKGGNSIGVLGAHVQAISRKTGEAIGAISDENGVFRIEGLDLNDTYYLYTSPIKNPNSLPGYFANIQNKFCPGSYVGSFYSSCGTEHDGKPTGITLTDNIPSVDVGTITISCSLRADQNYNFQKVQSSFNSLTIYDYGEEGHVEKSFVGWFRKTTNSVWSNPDLLRIDLSDYVVSGSPKYLKISLVSYPFGSQLEYEMTVKQNGVLIPDASRSMSYSLTTGTYNPDFSVFLPLGVTGASRIFDVSLRSRRLSSTTAAQTFPSFLQFSNDQNMPYLLITSLFEDSSGMKPIFDTGPILSDNESCLDGPFTFAVEKTSSPVSPASSSEDQQVAAAAGCGTIEPPGGGPGSSLPLMTLGFSFVVIASSLFKSRKKFLS
jgi:hypothetical protein